MLYYCPGRVDRFHLICAFAFLLDSDFWIKRGLSIAAVGKSIMHS
jgi:hypothetical protein